MLLTYGNGTDTRECSVGLHQPHAAAPSPIEAANHHATCLQSWVKRGERICEPSCHSQGTSFHFEREHQRSWGSPFSDFATVLEISGNME